jgi:hypothetical protein
MNKERYNQIIDEVYNIYIQKCRKDKDDFIKNNPRTLINYREDTKERFIESIKNNRHWFSGKLGFADEWGLKIEERELSLDERMQIWNERTEGFYIMLIWGHGKTQEESLSEHNIPTKLITLQYNGEKIEVHE